MRWLALLLALMATPASADLFGPPPAVVGRLAVPFIPSPNFVGVVDQETTVTHFWGIVAASYAKAVANTVAADLCNATGCTGANLCSSVRLLSTGYLDLFGLYCNSNTQSVTTWCSTNCISGGTGRVVKLYDQIGAINVASAAYANGCDFIIAASGSQWTGSKPVMGCNIATSNLTGVIPNLPSPSSYGGTWSRYGTAAYASWIDDTATNFALGNPNVSNQIYGQFYVSGGTWNVAATYGSGSTDFSHFHRAVMTTPSGAGTACMYVDGAACVTQAATGS